MTKSPLAALAAAAFLGLGPTHADPLLPAPAGTFVGTVTGVTEYWSRGLRQTNPGTGALQGSVEYDHPSGAYLGVWGSNTQLTQSPKDTKAVTANVELDVSGGVRGAFAFDPKATYDVGLIYYYYPGTQHADLDFDWLDVMGKVGYDAGFAQPSLKLLYSPDMQYESGTAAYVALDVGVPVGRVVTVTPHAGYQWVDDNARYGTPDYADYGLSVGASVLGLDVALQYVTTDRRKAACGPSGCDGFVLSVGKSF